MMNYRIKHGKGLIISLGVSVLSFVVIVGLLFLLDRMNVTDRIAGIVFFGCITGWYIQTIFSIYEKRGEKV